MPAARNDQPTGPTPPAPAGILNREFLCDVTTHPSCHASTLTATATGGMLAAWFGGQHEKAPDVGIWLTRRDAAGPWSAPQEVADGRQPDGRRWPCWNPVLFTRRDGAIMLFYKVGPAPSTWWGLWRLSRDDGRTWEPPRRLPEGILGPIKNKPIELPDGSLLSPSSSEHDGWRVHLERSRDGGATWDATAPLNDGWSLAAIQPSLLRLGGPCLLAIGRTRQGWLFEARSADLGYTWGPPVLAGLPNPNSGTDAVTLRDGRHLLVYNHTATGRSPLNLALSADGVAWQAAAVLEDDPGEYSYPAVIQTRDGLVHITYTWRRERIRYVVVDPDRLTPRPLRDGAWPSDG
ncbi:MAG: exo-alpha-sialidase [Lentisphaerae bacterium]|nr:exo-alpha-sialidase [Lentisphaerota bacterium]